MASTYFFKFPTILNIFKKSLYINFKKINRLYKYYFVTYFFYFVLKYVRRKWKEKVDTLIHECTQKKLVKVAFFLYGFISLVTDIATVITPNLMFQLLSPGHWCCNCYHLLFDVATITWSLMLQQSTTEKAIPDLGIVRGVNISQVFKS